MSSNNACASTLSSSGLSPRTVVPANASVNSSCWRRKYNRSGEQEINARSGLNWNPNWKLFGLRPCQHANTVQGSILSSTSIWLWRDNTTLGVDLIKFAWVTCSTNSFQRAKLGKSLRPIKLSLFGGDKGRGFCTIAIALRADCISSSGSPFSKFKFTNTLTWLPLRRNSILGNIKCARPNSGQHSTVRSNAKPP